MKLLVTGVDGQVARCLVERAAAHPEIEIVTVGRPVFDLALPETIEAAILREAPDIVVSAAAYTAVDQAEDEPQLAELINATSAGVVAEAARSAGAPVIHLSTDYVFAGDGDHAYVETDVTGPKGIYGVTKLRGEDAVMRANPRHLIMRTAWVYSPFGKNFVKTMLNLARGRDTISVVADQWGNPTSALDIADAIIRVAQRLQHSRVFTDYGIYHFAGTGATNWSGFAQHIMETSRALGGDSAEIVSIDSASYPTKAVRPKNSRLNTDKFFASFGWRAPDWHASATAVVQRLMDKTSAP